MSTRKINDLRYEIDVNDILKDYFSILNDSIIFISAVVGIFCFKKYRYSTAKYFIYFLIGAVFIDVFGKYPEYLRDIEFFNPIYLKIKGTIFIDNYWWYTLFWAVGTALFFSFYYEKALVSQRFRSVLRISRLLMLFVLIANIVYNWKAVVMDYALLVEVTSFIIVMLSALFYFIEILDTNQILQFHKNLNFYIASIIFIWWLITTPLIFYDNYFSDSDWPFVLLRYEVLMYANIFMYFGFAVALLYCKPEKSMIMDNN